MASTATDPKALNAAIRRLLPSDSILPDSITVGILSHNVVSLEQLKPSEVVFFTLNRETTLSELLEKYCNQFYLSGDIVLQLGPQTFDGATQLKEMIKDVSGFVGLQAVVTSTTVPQIKEENHTSLSSPNKVEPAEVTTSSGPDMSTPLRLSAGMLDGCSPSDLERLFDTACHILNDAKKRLRTSTSRQMEKNVDAIQLLQRKAHDSKAVVAIVGDKGTGKSSLINALLGMATFMPTSSSRACTAAIVEAAYNWDDGIKFRAEVDFLSPDEFREVYDRLIDDVRDEDGHLLPPCRDKAMPAAIAFDTLSAVFIGVIKEWDDLAKPFEELIQHERMAALGTVKSFRNDDSIELQKELRRYVAADDGWWPLVRVAKVFLKAECLKDGTILVDLPGFNDINTLRSKIADDYLKKCTSVWIVTPAIRAADDRTAWQLLSHKFWNQLKLDGKLDSVTWINTKIDDITVNEYEILDTDPEFQKLASQGKELSVKEASLNKKQTELDNQIKQAKKAIKADKSAVDQLEEQAVKAGILAVPQSRSKRSNKKRKVTEEQQQGKRRKVGAVKDTDTRPIIAGTTTSSTNDVTELTPEEISSRLQDARSRLASNEQQRDKIGSKLLNIERDIERIKTKQRKIDDVQMPRRCIALRNESFRRFMREQIKQAFPKPGRLRDTALNSWNIAFVSSKAAQKLEGRFERDEEPRGFATLEDTGIPDLRQRCAKEGLRAKEAIIKEMLIKIFELLHTVHNSAAQAIRRKQTVEPVDKEKELRTLQVELQTLQAEFRELVVTAITKIQTEEVLPLSGAFAAVASNAFSYLADVLKLWKLMNVRSLRAACKNNGSWTTSAGVEIDLSDDLARVIWDMAGDEWFDLFRSTIPEIFDDLHMKAISLLSSFHDGFAQRQAGKVFAHELGALQTRMKNHEGQVKIHCDNAVSNAQDRQKDHNRSPRDRILADMIPTFKVCGDEKGTGMGARIRTRLELQLQNETTHMFKTATDNVSAMLDVLFRDLGHDLIDRFKNQVDEIKIAYIATINQEQMNVTSQQEATLQNAMLEFVKKAEVSLNDAVRPPAVPEPAPGNDAAVNSEAGGTDVESDDDSDPDYQDSEQDDDET